VDQTYLASNPCPLPADRSHRIRLRSGMPKGTLLTGPAPNGTTVPVRRECSGSLPLASGRVQWPTLSDSECPSDGMPDGIIGWYSEGRVKGLPDWAQRGSEQ
jgi:hypothetical protein